MKFLFLDCYDVKDNYRLYGNSRDWHRKNYKTLDECENMAKADPRYIGWSYADGWASKACYLMKKIRNKGQDPDFISGMVKDNCKQKRGKTLID